LSSLPSPRSRGDRLCDVTAITKMRYPPKASGPSGLAAAVVGRGLAGTFAEGGGERAPPGIGRGGVPGPMLRIGEYSTFGAAGATLPAVTRSRLVYSSRRTAIGARLAYHSSSPVRVARQVTDEGVELIQIKGTGHITGLLILLSSIGRQS
jgi:hypothetical protein